MTPSYNTVSGVRSKVSKETLSTAHESMTTGQPEYTTSSTEHNYQKPYTMKYTKWEVIRAGLLWLFIFSVLTFLSGAIVRFVAWLFSLGFNMFGLL